MKKHIEIKDFSIDIYSLDRMSPCVIVVPGGGYIQLTENEGEPVTKKLNKAGYSSIVLRYNVKCSYPQPLNEFDDMMCYIEEHANEFNINVLQLIGIGFSAGGHLLANYQSYTNKKSSLSFKAIGLSYSLLDMVHLHSEDEKIQKFHTGGQRLVIGKENPTKIELEEFSPIYHVANVPTFLWHTADDWLIPCGQSIEYAKKLKERNIPFELHIFESGTHGLSLADETTATKEKYIRKDVAVWFDMFINFIKKYIEEKE